MQAPSNATDMMQQFLSAAGVKPGDLEARQKQGRLSFAATAYAMKNPTCCQACRFLSQAVDSLIGDATKEISTDAAGVSSQP